MTNKKKLKKDFNITEKKFKAFEKATYDLIGNNGFILIYANEDEVINITNIEDRVAILGMLELAKITR